MEYGKDAIHVEHNFASKQELDVLNTYMNDLPVPDFKSINLIGEIPNLQIVGTMTFLGNKIENFVKEKYFPKLGYSVAKVNWRRELELIKWAPYACLPAHRDGDVFPEHPMITVGALIYLNDEYLGGEIAFPEYDVSVKTEPGDLVIFPCQYLHEVKTIMPIEDGETRRHTMTVFYTVTLDDYRS
jgi:hypothetical protein